MRKLLNKKGQVSGAFGEVLGLVLIAVLVIVAIFLFISLSSTFVNLETVVVTGEALTPITAGVNVADAGACNFAGLGVDSAVNPSGELIAPANFTVVGGAIANTTGLVGDTIAPWSVNYTYNSGGGPCEASQSMVEQFGTYPTLIGLVGTVLFLGLVIGMLVLSFGGATTRRRI